MGTKWIFISDGKYVTKLIVMVKNVHKLCIRMQMIVHDSRIMALHKHFITQRELDVCHHWGKTEYWKITTKLRSEDIKCSTRSTKSDCVNWWGRQISKWPSRFPPHWTHTLCNSLPPYMWVRFIIMRRYDSPDRLPYMAKAKKLFRCNQCP